MLNWLKLATCFLSVAACATPAQQQAFCKVGEGLVQAFVPIPMATGNQQAAIQAAIDAACASLGGSAVAVATPAPMPSNVPVVVPPPMVLPATKS